ncbi:MAG: asparagine synthase C-terminal domain-containing protein, partial [Verrucomicrobiota bacterium]
ALPLEQRFQGTSCILTPGLKKRIYTPDFLHNRGDYMEETFTGLFDATATNPDPLGRMLYVDSRTWLVDDLLLKADKMTMAASIELRVPFLDHRLVELAASFPGEFKCRGHVGKRILKDVLKTRLPEELIKRKKIGFAVPVRHWLQHELSPLIRERLLQKEQFPWLKESFVESLIAQHASAEQDHSRLIFSLLALSVWREKFAIN